MKFDDDFEYNIIFYTFELFPLNVYVYAIINNIIYLS